MLLQPRFPRLIARIFLVPLSLVLLSASGIARADGSECADARKRLAAADELLVHGAYRQAAEAYAPLLECDEVRGDAISGLAQCRIAVGEYAAARGLLEVDVSDADRTATQFRLLAEVKAEVGEYTEALADARRGKELAPRSCVARLALAQLLEQVGQYEDAAAEYAWFERLVMRQLPIQADELTAAGIGFYRYSVFTRDPNLVDRTRHVLTQMFQMAYERLDENYWPARLATADLLAEKYNVEEAYEDYRAVLAVNTNAVEAHIGIGRLALDRWAFEEVDRCVDAALAVNTNSVMAFELRAASRMNERNYPAAIASADRALAINPHDIGAIALKASGHAALGQHAEADALIAQARALCPTCPTLDYVLADTYSGLRRYPEAEAHYKKAIELEPTASGPRTELGMMYMQEGNESKARDALEQSWKLDPFNDRTQNTLELLDRLDRFAELGDERFAIRYDAEHDKVIAEQFAAYLVEIYDGVCADFDTKLARKTVVEIFPSHMEFGVRIHGKPWIHTIGACTGWVIAMDAPRGGGDLPGPYNFAETLKHEFTHTVTLAATHNRIPHWFTEGLAVYEEQTGFSYAWKEMLADAIRRGELYPLADISWGFMRPTKPTGRQQAYAQSEWMCEYLIATYGREVIKRMLTLFDQGKSQEEVFREITGGTEAEFDQRFAVWATEQAKGWGLDLTPPEDVDALRELIEKSPEDAALLARLARAEIDADAWSAAKESAERCLKLDPENRGGMEAQVRVWLHEIADTRDPSEARKIEEASAPIADRLLAADANNRYALQIRAIIHLRRKELDAAVPFLEKLDKSWPQDPIAAASLASILYDKGEYDAALPYYLKVATDDTQDHEAFFRIGDIHERAGRLPDAREAYRQAVYAHPLSEDAHLRLAEVAMRLSDVPSAVAEYRTLCEIAPTNAKYYERCALAYRKQGNQEQMRTFAKRAVELDPRSSAATMLSD